MAMGRVKFDTRPMINSIRRSMGNPLGFDIDERYSMDNPIEFDKRTLKT